MRKVKQIILTLLLMFVVFSCSNDSPFSGTDNRLLSLKLMVNEQEYKGVVTADNTIEITVPVETDLNNAKVEYTISEQASILPNPEKITDWNNEQVFNVISYSGEKRTYIVRVIRLKGEATNDVVLTTDEEVRAFAEKNISRIRGNLIIGKESGADSIKNIDALTYLKKVDYRVIINPTYKGRDLSGLRNVTEVGELRINDNKFVQDLTLKSLQIVYEDLFIKTDTLREIHFPELVRINGNVRIEASRITGLDLPRLETVSGFSLKGDRLSMLRARKLENITGDLTFESLLSLARVDLPKLQQVTGNVTMKGLNTLGTLSLPVLKTVEGNFTLENSPAIVEFFIPSLERTRSFKISNNVKLSRMMVPKIEEADGDFMLSGCPFDNLNQVSVKVINGKLSLIRLTSLQDVKPFFKSLQKVADIDVNYLLMEGSLDISHLDFNGTLKIQNCSNLEHVKLPKELNEIAISGASNFSPPTITEISGLVKANKITYSTLRLETPRDFVIKELKEVANELSLNIGNVVNVSLPDLEIAASIQIRDDNQGTLKSITIDKLISTGRIILNSTSLETLKAPLLKEITNILNINGGRGNSAMQDLNGLSSLESITSLTLYNLPSFKDYTFLKKSIDSGVMTEDRWNKNVKLQNVAYTPTFQDLKDGQYVKP
jgi:signal recognition particle subunit SEC65